LLSAMKERFYSSFVLHLNRSGAERDLGGGKPPRALRWFPTPYLKLNPRDATEFARLWQAATQARRGAGRLLALNRLLGRDLGGAPVPPRATPLLSSPHPQPPPPRGEGPDSGRRAEPAGETPALPETCHRPFLRPRSPLPEVRA